MKSRDPLACSINVNIKEGLSRSRLVLRLQHRSCLPPPFPPQSIDPFPLPPLPCTAATSSSSSSFNSFFVFCILQSWRFHSAIVCHRGSTRRTAAATGRDIPQKERRTEERKVKNLFFFFVALDWIGLNPSPSWSFDQQCPVRTWHSDNRSIGCLPQEERKEKECCRGLVREKEMVRVRIFNDYPR